MSADVLIIAAVWLADRLAAKAAADRAAQRSHDKAMAKLPPQPVILRAQEGDRL